MAVCVQMSPGPRRWWIYANISFYWRGVFSWKRGAGSAESLGLNCESRLGLCVLHLSESPNNRNYVVITYYYCPPTNTEESSPRWSQSPAGSAPHASAIQAPGFVASAPEAGSDPGLHPLRVTQLCVDRPLHPTTALSLWRNKMYMLYFFPPMKMFIHLKSFFWSAFFNVNRFMRTNSHEVMMKFTV